MGINPSEIPQTGGHGANMLVSSRYNLPVSLGRHSLDLSSDCLRLSSNGLGHLQKGTLVSPSVEGGGLTEAWSSLETFSRGT